jgi:hypothetical protein
MHTPADATARRRRPAAAHALAPTLAPTLLPALLAAALLALAGCPGPSVGEAPADGGTHLADAGPGAPPDAGPAPPPDGGTVARPDDLGESRFDAAARNAAIDRVAVEYERLLAAGGARPLDALATFVRAQPEFAAAGAEDGALWARFTDGRAFVFADNFRALPAPAAPAPPTAPGVAPAPAPASVVTASAVSSPLPGAPRALVVQQDLPDTAGHTPTLEKISASLEKRGYVVQRASSVSVDGLKVAARNLGVFYFHGHGARWYWGDGQETREYALLTDALVSEEGEARYAEDVRRGRLVYSYKREEREPGRKYSGRYALTGRFVSAYFSLAPRALVYLNACNGGSDAARHMREAFLDGGAGLVLGYAGNTTTLGYAPAAYFFDRLLGGNLAEPPSPAGRPFRVDEVWAAMAGKRHADEGFGGVDYLTDPPNGSPLLRFGGATRALAPTIKALRFFRNDLMGVVTDAPLAGAQVRVGGRVLPHQEHEGMLVVELGPDAHGDVVLEVDGVRSNARPVASWRGPVTLEQWMAPGVAGATAKLTVTYQLHLRADALAVRRAVDGALEEEGTAFYAASDSTASYAFSGSVEGATYGGSGPLALAFPATPGTFSATGLVHATEGRVRLAPLFHSVSGTVSVGGFSTPVGPVALQPAAFEYHDPAPVPGREVVGRGWFAPLSPDLSIAARTFSARVEGVEVARISWPRLAPELPLREGVEH